MRVEQPLRARIAHAAHPAAASANAPAASHEAHGRCTACSQAHAGARMRRQPGATSPKHGPEKHDAEKVVDLKMYMGKKNGKMHALTSNANFTVAAGKPVTVRITNVDEDMEHSFTIPDLGIDIKVPPGKDGKPTVKTVTFTPKKAGEISWYCKVPCDPEAMKTDGMMRGTITVEK